MPSPYNDCLMAAAKSNALILSYEEIQLAMLFTITDSQADYVLIHEPNLIYRFVCVVMTTEPAVIRQPALNVFQPFFGAIVYGAKCFQLYTKTRFF